MRIVLLVHNLRVAGGFPVGRNIVATLGEIAPGHKYLIVVPGMISVFRKLLEDRSVPLFRQLASKVK